MFEESEREKFESSDEPEEEKETEGFLSEKEARESLESLGLSPEETKEVPDYDKTVKTFSEGDIVKGTVVKVDNDEVLLDIGYKSEGVIPARELSIRHDVKPPELVSVGDELEALVLQKEDKEGRLILSKKRAQYERAWSDIERIKNEDGVVEGEVIEVVKGGLIVDIGLRGFLPASLVDLKRIKDLSQFIGQKIEAKVIELDRNRNNVVLSRRAHLEGQKSLERKSLLDNLKKGMKCTGKVSSIVNFGAFVDIGGIDGLVHVSQLAWRHVDHPSEILSVGQEVEVEVLDVDVERERISLSMKKTEEDPWEKLGVENPPGSTVRGKVTKILPYGAFVEIAPGVEGLVHVSELSWNHVELPEEVIAVGNEVEVKIIDIDLERRRISLSVKQLTSPEGKEEAEEANLEERRLLEASEYREYESPSPEQETSFEEREEISKEAKEIAAQVSQIEMEVSSIPDTQDTPLEEDSSEEASDEAEPSPQPAEPVSEAPSEEDSEEGESEKPEGEGGSLESILADMQKESQNK